MRFIFMFRGSNMKKRLVVMAVTASLLLTVSSSQAGSASEDANKMADNALYKPVEYINSQKQGPALVVISGEIKSNNVEFTRKFASNNIADFAEIELSRANFQVIERSDLGSLFKEFQLAYTMGDPDEAAKFLTKGKFKSTKWVVKFDIIKAEPVAEAGKSFNGQTLGSLASFIPGVGMFGAVAGTVAGSVKTDSQAKIWIVGLRYKIIDASTTEQKATGYIEGKMEIGSNGTSVLGVSDKNAGGLTLDSMVQRLVQACVAEMDNNYK